MAKKNEKYICIINRKSRTNNITVEILQRNKSYQKNKKNYLLLRVFFLSLKISPITPVSNKKIKSSNNSVNLTVHWEIKYLLFEISTEFVDVKIKTKIQKRDNFCKRLDTKFKIFTCCCIVAKKNRW